MKLGNAAESKNQIKGDPLDFVFSLSLVPGIMFSLPGVFVFLN